MTHQPPRIRLACGDLLAEVAPEVGGSLARFEARGLEVMRGAVDARSGDVLEMACYPLIPFSGRIAEGRFVFEGREVRLAADPVSHPHALHGLGWRRGWDVAEVSATHAVLALTHEGSTGDDGVWPWAFAARETFTLDEAALTIALEIENRAEGAMPAGLGLHPFFSGRTIARLTGDLPFIWESTLERIPIRIAQVQATRKFTRGRRVAPLTLDHCFSGSDGPLDIEWDDKPLKLRIERRGAAHTIIYTPQEQDFFCVEPSSHAPDAVNRREGAEITGLRVLKPGETMRMECRFEVRED